MRIIRTDYAPAPVAGAPYSQAVAAHGGETVWVSGQVPLDPVTGAIAAPDAAGQTQVCLEHIQAILVAAGGSLADVVKTTVFLTDLAGDFSAMNEVYAAMFGDARPARATIGVVALPASCRVEIEAVAVIAHVTP
ncbi:MAG: hypothetical protein EXQ74_04400 [Thermoleophilia bacterium]|nr:hypothetical protein [Thermoleophilia bacterium]